MEEALTITKDGPASGPATCPEAREAAVAAVAASVRAAGVGGYKRAAMFPPNFAL